MEVAVEFALCLLDRRPVTRCERVRLGRRGLPCVIGGSLPASAEARARENSHFAFRPFGWDGWARGTVYLRYLLLAGLGRAQKRLSSRATVSESEPRP